MRRKLIIKDRKEIHYKKSEGNTEKTRKETLKKRGRKLFIKNRKETLKKNEEENSEMKKETLTPQSHRIYPIVFNTTTAHPH